jgi:hypothetical protein
MIFIATLAIGEDFKKKLAPALKSKEAYAKRNGYTYLQADEAVWDRTRPIAWSKVGFVNSILSRVPDGTIIWLSDADVLITNPLLRLEDHVLPLLPSDKDILLTMDACGHLNSGNMILRASKWTRDFWLRVDSQTDCTYHIWWENAAIIKLMESSNTDREKIEVTAEHTRFNAYLQGLPEQPLWKPGDFLIHFAGIYDLNRMERLIRDIQGGKIPRLDMMDPNKITYLSI